MSDIHGCLTALRALMNAVQPQHDDRIVFLGDYIDRGPDSKGVLDWLIAAPWPIVALRGNHEVMILEALLDPMQFRWWLGYGGVQTLASYNTTESDDWRQAIPASHWKLLDRTRKWYETETHIFVHANIDPELDLIQQSDYTLCWDFSDRSVPHKSGKPVICGHTPQESGRPGRFPSGICIDTGIYLGGWLTCLDVNTGTYWQSNQASETRMGQL